MNSQGSGILAGMFGCRRPAGVIAVGAGASQGTTSFLLTAVLDVALGASPAPTALFTPGTTRAGTAADLVGLESGIGPYWRASTDRGMEAWPRVLEAAKLLSEARLYLDDNPALAVEDLCARVEELAGQGEEFGLVAADDLYLMSIRRRPYVAGSPGLGEELVGRLRALALKLQAPVLVSFKLGRRACDFLAKDKLEKIELPKALVRVADAVLLLRRGEMRLDRKVNAAGRLIKNAFGRRAKLEFEIDEAGRYCLAGRTPPAAKGRANLFRY